MFIERMKLVPLLGCVVLLAACPGEDSPKKDAMEPDAGEELGDAGDEPGDDPGDEPVTPSKPKPEPEQPAKPASGGGAKPGKETPAQPSSPSEPSNPSTPDAPSKPAMNPGNGQQPPAQPADNPSKPSGNGPGSGSTRPFFLPTPEPRNTQTPRIELDAKGGLHSLYPAGAAGGAFYSYCPNNCVDPSKMKVVEFETDTVPTNAMLAVTPDGKPRVLVATYLHLYYAQCDRDCTDEANWTNTLLMDHQSQQDVTGDALAVDSQGRPRFIMHTYVAYLGVGQKEPHTHYVQCDQGCSDPENWSMSTIQDQMWTYSTLRIDEADRAHLGTIIISPTSSVKQIAYVRCDANCESSGSWSGVEIAPAFENPAGDVKPSVSLALTSTGGARMVGLVMPEPGSRSLVYFECDQACDQGNWAWRTMSDAYELGSGVDLELDAKDRPRFVFTQKSNIGLSHCADSHCTAQNAPWQTVKVEYASELTPDTIILWPNCVADAWLLHDPKLVLAADGSARVGYQATDVSGGFNTMPDPTKPACLVGKDMTFGRLALMPSL
ncbi:MAG TPA: hypothetical protein VJV78_40775 [Polyangiales bacterium]|nr:hypothetical protein [Polyangiales bacterium]